MSNLLSGITAKIMGRSVPLFAWPVLNVGVAPDGTPRAVAVNDDGTAAVTAPTRWRNTALGVTKTAVTADAAQFMGCNFINQNDEAVYVKFYDGAEADVTVGSTVPEMTLAVPANGVLLLQHNGCTQGAFQTGIVVAATKQIADSDTTAPDTALYAEVCYK